MVLSTQGASRGPIGDAMLHRPAAQSRNMRPTHARRVLKEIVESEV